MFNAPIPKPSHYETFRQRVRRATSRRGYFLTTKDRRGIQTLLDTQGTRFAANPPMLQGFLRHKLRISAHIDEPVPSDLAISGRLVSYMISGEGARSGVLSLDPLPHPGNILVTSLLGATLIGMRALQKVPLLREDGQIDTVVVLDVSPNAT